jgi:hypothetical protein
MFTDSDDSAVYASTIAPISPADVGSTPVDTEGGTTPSTRGRGRSVIKTKSVTEASQEKPEDAGKGKKWFVDFLTQFLTFV